MIVSAERRAEYVRLGAQVVQPYENAYTAYLCGSIVEGFGNEQSDLDAFVLTEGPAVIGQREELATDATFDEFQIDIQYLDDTRIDTETWEMAKVQQIIQAINECPVDQWYSANQIDTRWFQLVHGIRIGWATYEPQRFAQLQATIDLQHMSHVMYCVNMLNQTGFVEDATGAIKSGDHGTAYLTSKIALGYAVDAVLAAAGSTNPKPKWRFSKLRQLGLDDLANRYLLADIDKSEAPEDILAVSKQRLRLAGTLSLEAAQLVGRLPTVNRD